MGYLRRKTEAAGRRAPHPHGAGRRLRRPPRVSGAVSLRARLAVLVAGAVAVAVVVVVVVTYRAAADQQREALDEALQTQARATASRAALVVDLTSRFPARADPFAADDLLFQVVGPGGPGAAPARPGRAARERGRPRGGPGRPAPGPHRRHRRWPSLPADHRAPAAAELATVGGGAAGPPARPAGVEPGRAAADPAGRRRARASGWPRCSASPWPAAPCVPCRPSPRPPSTWPPPRSSGPGSWSTGPTSWADWPRRSTPCWPRWPPPGSSSSAWSPTPVTSCAHR